MVGALKAALIGFPSTGEPPVVVVFQYNPETLARAFPPSVAGPVPPTPGSQVISFTMSLDAFDFDLPVDPIAEEFGVLPTLTALDQLAAESSGPAPWHLLFVWGPHRMLAVQLVNLIVRETAFNAALAPVRADADVTLRLLDTVAQDAPQQLRRAHADNQAARKSLLDRLPRDVPDYIARILK